MTEDRPYRAALGPDVALGLVEEGAGTQFDPVIAQALVDMLGEPSSPLDVGDGDAGTWPEPAVPTAVPV